MLMRFNVLVKEIMKKDLKTVKSGDRIKKAAEIMRKNKIGSVLVNGKDIAIVTATDIVYKHVATGKGKTVKDIMTKDVVRISPNKTIEHAARLMTEKNIEKLPVFEKDKLVGIVTATDILRIEPALFETLLERLMISEKGGKEEQAEFFECESCGNYSDDVKEVNGVYICSECEG